jgi:hypothetical protein
MLARTSDDLAADPELDLWLAESLKEGPQSGSSSGTPNQLILPRPSASSGICRRRPAEVFPVRHRTALAEMHFPSALQLLWRGSPADFVPGPAEVELSPARPHRGNPRPEPGSSDCQHSAAIGRRRTDQPAAGQPGHHAPARTATANSLVRIGRPDRLLGAFASRTPTVVVHHPFQSTA